MDSKTHWEGVYRTKGPRGVSWFQPEARVSLELIQRVAPDLEVAILDAGGGASTLVDGLLAAGYSRVSVLDLSAAALRQARERVGGCAAEASWLEGDVLAIDLPLSGIDVWHDRAVFHFLTAVADRRRYVAQVRQGLRPGGHIIVATFADDGPTRCSGLDVARYTPQALHEEFGPDFALIESRREEHVTPWGARQAFTYCVCRFTPSPSARE